ncbi:MAG: hypothetical protein JSS76_03600 [Bacteroidetes bacterium]|nr:hypothetical protein [Bacteroidota bacterium]
MKRLLLLIACALTLPACSFLSNNFDSGQKIGEYGVTCEYPDDSVMYHSIPVDSPQLSQLLDGDEILSNSDTAILYLDYPLDKPAIFTITSGDGFTKGEVISIISEKYHAVYASELKTPGKYGICCRTIGDLVVSLIEVSRRKDGRIVFTTMIDS